MKPELNDAEIIMAIFRLMRDGGHRTAAAVLRAAKEAFPDEPPERIERCMHELAKRMLLR